MVTVHILYDPLVFYTNTEYHELHPGAPTVNIQSEVEQPEIHLLTAGTEDQAGLMGDRLSCILDLSNPVIWLPSWDTQTL